MKTSPEPHPRVVRRKPRGLAIGRSGRAQPLGEQAFGPALRMFRYRLGNGLQLLVMPDASAPVLSYHTFYRVGSKHEQPGKTGLAHLFEHLMFNQTSNLAAGELDRRIEARGGETNASTWTDWTHYHTDLPARELSCIVELEADRMQNLVLRAPQVSSEIEVVANERRQRVDDDVEGAAFEKLYATAFRKHPYRWPTIGWMRDIRGFTPADCERFYRTFYAPNNAILVVVGDVDPGRLLALVERHYGAARPAKLPRFSPKQEGAQTRERVVRMPWPTHSGKLLLGYRAPALGDPDYPVLAMINELLFVGRSSRMFQRLLRGEELVSDLHASIAPFEDPGLYEIWLSLRPGVTLAKARRAFEDELRRLVREPVPEDELSRVKHRVELGYLLGLETAHGKAEQIGFYETVLHDAGRVFTRLAEYKAVTPEAIARVARSLLDPRRRTRVEVLPTGGQE